jgi:UDP-3-O-[3-hydroxymyristoyl] glucosamine N-acyltransferase
MTKINLTVQELCNVVEGVTSLDPSILIKNISSIESAQQSDVAVLFDPEELSVFAPLSLEKIKACGAGAILASKEVVPNKNYIIVKDPVQALEKIAQFIETCKQKNLTNIHESAVVGEFAVVEDDVIVGPNAVICDDAKIGRGARIGAQVYIGRGATVGCNAIIHPGAKILDRCVVGDHSIIHAGAVIGSDGFGYRVMKTGLRKVAHVGIVRIGKHVEIGANTAIDRSEFDETVIGDGVKIDNCVHIAHNVKISPCSAILAHTAIAGSVEIGTGCQIGGQVAIKDHVKIGDGAKIVSKSAVMRDVAPKAIVCGIPSMPFSQWKRMMIVLTKLPEYVKMFKKKRKKWWWF